jgi:hypothetical protein
VVGAVLEALAAPGGAEDDRTREQRYHDALAEAMRRLAASDLLPARAGQPVRAWAHMSLAGLLRLDGSSALQQEWTVQVRAAWAARRAAASQAGGDGGAWLDGDAAEAIACDAAMAPVVTGDVNPGALEDLVRLCAELGRLGHGGDGADADAGGTPGTPGPVGPGRDPHRGDPAGPALPVGRRLRPARGGLPGAPHQAQGQRREDIRYGLRLAVHVPPSSGDPSVGLDPGAQPGRHHHGVEQGPDEGPAQPRTTRPAGVSR